MKYAAKRYAVAVLRERLSEALDAAYHGVPVLIERKGVHYRLVRDAPPKTRRPTRTRLFARVDPAVASGAWTWDWAPDGLVLRVKRRRRP